MSAALSVSNIAWPSELDGQALELLSDWGVKGVEIAPTRVWPDWQGAEASAAGELRKELARMGLVCSAFQSLLHGLPDLTVFAEPEERARTLSHLERVVDLAEGAGAQVLVFGSPRNRDPGSRTPEVALAVAAAFFSEVGTYCAGKGVVMALEPNPPEYGCAFLTDALSTARFVRQVASPGIGLNLDAAALHLARESTAEVVDAVSDVLAHVHVSEPFLGDFAAPRAAHRKIAEALRSIVWSRWVSIEMVPSQRPLAALDEAVAFTLDAYGSVLG